MNDTLLANLPIHALSGLQWALLAIGMAVVVGVVLLNKMQEHRTRRADRSILENSDDALLRTTSPRVTQKLSRPEPVMVPDSVVNIDTTPEITFEDDIELIVSLSFDQPVAGERLAVLAEPLTRLSVKPVQVAATHAESNHLEWPAAGQLYSGLHCSVLLADRQGPLSDVQFSIFVGEVQRIGTALDVEIDVPDMAETLARAVEIDGRCAKIDTQIGVNIVSQAEDWTGVQIVRAAVESGMAQQPDGRFLYVRRNGAELFSLRALDAQGRFIPLAVGTADAQVTALTVVLDVPRAPEVEKPFPAMIALARVLAERLNGIVVDDNRRPVTDAALASIETQLKPMYTRLRAAGFEAGTQRAMRAFNG